MPMKKYKPEQIVTLLRQIEVEIANGKTTPQACRDAQITAQTFYRWRKEFGGLKLDQAKRMKELERENAKLKRLVAELSLEKQILKDVAEGKALWQQMMAARRRKTLMLCTQCHHLLHAGKLPDREYQATSKGRAVCWQTSKHGSARG